MQSRSLHVNLVRFLAIQPRDIAEVSTSVCFVAHSILILCLSGCHTRYYANYYVQRNKVTQIANQTYCSHECEFIHTSQHFFMERGLCELFANMMVTSWYVNLVAAVLAQLIDRTIKRTFATNCARIYNTSFTNESIRGSISTVWHVTLEMDVDHVWDGFYIYLLLLDHAERDAVLYLDHNAASQAKRIRPALQARNCRMRGTGQEEWSHACELCTWAYVDEHGVKRMFYFHQFNIFPTLAQGPFIPWSLMVSTWAVHVV